MITKNILMKKYDYLKLEKMYAFGYLYKNFARCLSAKRKTVGNPENATIK